MEDRPNAPRAELRAIRYIRVEERSGDEARFVMNEKECRRMDWDGGKDRVCSWLLFGPGTEEDMASLLQ